MLVLFSILHSGGVKGIKKQFVLAYLNVLCLLKLFVFTMNIYILQNIHSQIMVSVCWVDVLTCRSHRQ